MFFRLRIPLYYSALCASLLFTAPKAFVFAHIIPDTVTLSQRIAAADLVVRARISDPNITIKSGNPIVIQQLVEATIEQSFRTKAPSGNTNTKNIRFIPHRHNSDGYEKGEEIILFLKFKKAQSPGAEGQFISIDDFADRISLDPSNTAAFIEAVSAYANALSPQNNSEIYKPKDFKQITLGLLFAEQPRLAAFALRDLLNAQNTALIQPEDLPKLEQLIENKKYSIALRTALLSELGRKQMIKATPTWLKLLRNTEATDLATVTRSLPQPLAPELHAELEGLLKSPSSEAIKAAALALGSANNDIALEALESALSNTPDPSVRRTLVESMARIGTTSAQLKLQEIAKNHEDTDLRKSAQTELNLIHLRTKSHSTDAGASQAPLSSAAQNAPPTPSNETPKESGPIQFYLIMSAAILGAILFIAAYWTRRQNKRGAAPPLE